MPCCGFLLGSLGLAQGRGRGQAVAHRRKVAGNDADHVPGLDMRHHDREIPGRDALHCRIDIGHQADDPRHQNLGQRRRGNYQDKRGDQAGADRISQNPAQRVLGDADLDRTGQALGMNNYIKKPFAPEALKACIERVVGRL